MKNCATFLKSVITGLLILAPPVAGAEWSIVTQNITDGSGTTRVAHITNEDGYSLEVYRDPNNVIRLHLSMNTLNRLDGKDCPTFQIDKRSARNRSINDAPCLIQSRWAEYVLGYIIDSHVTSSILQNLLNGNLITFRFILRDSGYAETSFTLTGSKRVILEILGNDLVVSTEKDLP